MKLYFFYVAPNPTKVRLYLAEKAAGGTRIDLEEVKVNLGKGEQKQPEHMARNPFGKLPVLELDDGTFLSESLAIMEYLEELHPDPPMIGTNPLERARIRELERIAELGVLFPAARVVHSTDSPLDLPPSAEMVEYFTGVLDTNFKVIERCLSDGRLYLTGEHPTIADCTLQAGLQFARYGKLELDPSFTNLIRWDQGYRNRSHIKSVLTL